MMKMHVRRALISTCRRVRSANRLQVRDPPRRDSCLSVSLLGWPDVGGSHEKPRRKQITLRLKLRQSTTNPFPDPIPATEVPTCSSLASLPRFLTALRQAHAFGLRAWHVRLRRDER
jgi:hypothetical protein